MIGESTKLPPLLFQANITELHSKVFDGLSQASAFLFPQHPIEQALDHPVRRLEREAALMYHRAA
jgi:hypothetical protein